MMKIRKFDIDLYDYGIHWEKRMNKELFGATHIHMTNAPYNKFNGEPKTIILYAFYPDEIQQEEE